MTPLYQYEDHAPPRSFTSIVTCGFMTCGSGGGSEKPSVTGFAGAVKSVTQCARLAVAADQDVPTVPKRHRVVAVDGAVLRSSRRRGLHQPDLRPRQRPLAQLRPGIRVVEEGGLLHGRIARLALRLSSATGFPAEDDD